MSDYLSCAETAKLLREQLKRNFPGIKFSVRSSVYSGGASIDVRWSLGPTDKEVNRVSKQFQGGGFDGSIDMAYNYEHWLLPDGTAQIESTPGTSGSMGYVEPIESTPRPEGAKHVSFGADYVFTQREIPEDVFIQLSKDICKLQNIEYTGYDTRNLYGPNDHEFVSHHARLVISEISFKPGEEYESVRYKTEEERQIDYSSEPITIIKKQTQTTEPLPKVDGIEIRKNEEKNGIEIIFPCKPDSAIIETLKSMGFRWSNYQGLWYNKFSESLFNQVKAAIC